MNYSFKGVIKSYKNYSIPFNVASGKLCLNVSKLPYSIINVLDFRGHQIINGKTLFRCNYLEGETDDGMIIKFHISNYYVNNAFQPEDIRYIFGNVESCVVLEKDKYKTKIDKIGFYSYEISDITCCSVTGEWTREYDLLIPHNRDLAKYVENNNQYFVSYDFLEKAPYYRGQIFAISSDKELSQIMMEDIYWTMRKFFAFIYQRKEVPMLDVALIEDDNVVGHLFIRDFLSENHIMMGTKCLRVASWGERLSNLFQAFVDKKIYLRHLPDFEKEKKIHTPTRFLMTVVGFESVLDNSGIKVKHSEKHSRTIKKISDSISSLMNENAANSEERRIYKKMLKNIDGDSFRDKIIVSINENAEYIKNFYILDRIGESSIDIAEKISDSRNKFAHGNLEEDLTTEHAYICEFLDLFILYLQLISVGFSKEEASTIVPQVLFRF